MLNIQFSTLYARIQISCDTESYSELRRLRSRFSTATNTGNYAFDVEIDDLLTNLFELASWPEDDTVIWQKELLELVETNALDAAIMEHRLVSPNEIQSLQLSELGPDWSAPLTDFQKRDLGKLLELKHGANFSVPGAGKTRVGLGAFEARRKLKEVCRLLVISPKSAFESWISELNECYDQNVPTIEIVDSIAIPKSDILLINYERLPDATPNLIRWLKESPALLILDEAHRTKLGSSGAWGGACLSLAPYAARRMILTGTPAPNGAKDLENLFAFVWPGQGRSRVANAVSNANLRVASQRLRPLFSRTTKNELGLPPVDIAVRRVALPPLHRELYNALLGQYAGPRRGGEQEIARLGKITLYLLMAATSPALLSTGSSRHEPLPYRIPPILPPAGSSLESLMRDLPLFEMSPKYQEVLALVSANAHAGRKTLIWSTFVRNLKSLGSLLARFSPAIIHGGTEDRTQQLRRFREDPNCLVLLSNPATLGEGVSLHHDCHDAIYLDRDFAAGRYLQSLDRIHRLGLHSETKTRITILIADETIDEVVAQRLEVKLNFMGGVLDDPSVTQLGDLNEEPSETAGMNNADVLSLISYLDTNVTV